MLADVLHHALRDRCRNALSRRLSPEARIDEPPERVVDGPRHCAGLNRLVPCVHAHDFTLIVGLAVELPGESEVSVTAGGVVPPIGATCVCVLYFVMRSLTFDSSASSLSSTTPASASASSASSFAEFR